MALFLLYFLKTIAVPTFRQHGRISMLTYISLGADVLASLALVISVIFLLKELRLTRDTMSHADFLKFHKPQRRKHAADYRKRRITVDHRKNQRVP